jgi:hypothetical protein
LLQPGLYFWEREKTGKTRKPGEFMKYFQAITTPIGEKQSGYATNYRFYELIKAKSNAQRLKSTAVLYPWVQRGPGNVGGRTRSVIVDPDDPAFKTWYAAAVSGGIWKTTDEGKSWTNMTPDLPNLATNTMAMAPSDHNTMYVGTGEGYGGVGMVGGNGIIKSTDRGISWHILDATTVNDNFRFVNKILIDPSDKNIVLVSTNKGIFRSVNGGSTWQGVYEKTLRIFQSNMPVHLDTEFLSRRIEGYPGFQPIMELGWGGDSPWLFHRRVLIGYMPVQRRWVM